MNCPNCHELTEDGAAYCGNCGHRLKGHAAEAGSVALRGYNNGYNSGYTLTLQMRHVSETHALMSLLCGVTGLAGALFFPFLGLALGLAGIVLGTVSRVYTSKATRLVGLVLSVLAILVGLAAWAHAVRNDPRINPNVARVAPADSEAQVSTGLATPCYSLSFVDELNISNKMNSCDMNAFNGSTLEASTNAYKIYASTVETGSVNDFTNLAKTAVEKDLAKTVPDFKIGSERASTFAGSPAFMVAASDSAQQVSVVEAIVYHQVSNGNNAFVIVHANNGASADLQILESQWQWK
jgi:hypothetical protein